MNSEFFLNTIRERSKNPFVFISYSSSIVSIKKRVLVLGKHLENTGINVIYDMGGMPVGIDIDEFMRKIADDNCKYVLLVCDHTYKEKTQEINSGVRIEYKYLLNRINNSQDREKELSKVFLLMAEDVEEPQKNVPDLFTRRIYTPFYDNTIETLNTITKLVMDCKIPLKRDYSDKELREKSLYKYEIANKSYDIGQYSSALKNINDAINLHLKIKRKDKLFMINCNNLASATNLMLGHKIEARKICLENLKLLKKDQYDLLSICYGNLALSYVNDDNYIYEEYAKKAYEIAKGANLTDFQYYITLYAASLFMTERYEEAYNCQLESLTLISQNNAMDTLLGLQTNANIAEICVLRAKKKRGSKKIELLYEAEAYICSALSISKKISLREDTLHELYSITEKVYNSLKEYYE